MTAPSVVLDIDVARTNILVELVAKIVMMV